MVIGHWSLVIGEKPIPNPCVSRSPALPISPCLRVPVSLHRSLVIN
ncbi:hypothetical protein [Trichormus sp. NMC-1]|nr:hypothetical protein [Trichormus sp. NMC-1]